MKKISAVLLVLVLVGSVAFAGFTGSAETTFGVDLGTGDYGFTNDALVTGDIVFHETLVDNAGDGDIYAAIKAELTLAFDFEDVASGTDVHIAGIAGNAEITEAKIYGDGWWVSILGAMAAPNFAESAIDVYGADDDPVDLDPSDYVSNGEVGVEIGYADYTLGLSIPYGGTDNNFTNGDYDIMGAITTPDFELGDGLTMAFGAAGRLATANKAISASAKGSYTMDDVTASVAADLVYDAGIEAEVAVNAVIDPVTLDVYFATTDDDTPNTNLLSAKAAFAIEQFDIEVTGMDLINVQDLGVSVDFAASDALSVNVNGGFVLSTSAWSAGAGVTYTAEKYVASADATYSSAGTLEVNASVESDSIVNGATLSLGYETADILTAAGKVTAGAKIEF